MSTSRLNCRILWSPHKDSNLFLIGSNNDLRLYEYIPKGPANFKLIFVNPDIASMRCIAWSPDSNFPSLIAAGFANGKTYLVNIHDESTLSESHVNNYLTSSKPFNVLSQQPPYAVLNSKNSKPCNEVEFSLADPRLLATGSDKVRNDYCLLIWDVERAAKCGDKNYCNTPKLSAEMPSRTGSISGWSVKSDHNDVGVSPGGFGGRGIGSVVMDDNYTYPLEMARSGYSMYESPFVPRPQPAASYNTRTDETKPIHNFGLSEYVNSISWIRTTKQLVAGMSGKFLKIFDLRSTENPAITITTKAVFGVKTDPYNDHRFASFEEVSSNMGNILLWDDPRSGLLASLSNDTSYISLYDIQETTCKLQPYSTTLSNNSSPLDEVNPLNSGFGSDGGVPIAKSTTSMGSGAGFVPSAGIVMGAPNNPAFNEKINGNGVGVGGGISISGSKADDELDIPILWKSRKTQKLSKLLVSFAWIPTMSSPHSHRLLVINKESTLETVTLEECINFGWEPRGNINSGSGYGHKHRVSLDLKVDNDYGSGNRTPRPSDLSNSSKDVNVLKKQLKGIMMHRSHDDLTMGGGLMVEKDDDDKELLILPLKTFQEDISVVMRKRAKQGYSMICRANEDLVRDSPKLKTLWNWIARAEKLSSEGKSCIGNNDFNFQGIHSVWKVASTGGSKRVSPMSTPKASPPKSFSERSDQEEIDINEIPITVLTSKLSQRKLALTICGWGFGKKELEETLQRMERAGNYEKAAGWALFHDLPERAIAALNNSKDERLKLVSTALAGYAANNNDVSYQASLLWREMCINLSVEMRNPYLRAIFSFIACGHWLDVLQEEGLPLQDRIGIALRSLNDEELNNFLHGITEKVIATGNIDGIILTGLTPEGVSLFENYINNTCDVQTASLALSFCVPRKFKDSRVTNWVENYRMLLDQWQMFHIRARFDIARGKHMISSTSSAADMVPPQVYVRCNFCSQSITHSLFIPGMKGKDGERFTLPASYYGAAVGMISKQKTTCCPGCRKPLPRCSICLLSLGTPTDSKRESIAANQQNGFSNDKPFGFDLWFTWCQSCHHGGHAIHMLQWFQKHKLITSLEDTLKVLYKRPSWTFDKVNKVLEIPDSFNLNQKLTEDRGDYEVTAKLFYLPSSSTSMIEPLTPPPQFVSQSVYHLFKLLGINTIDTFIIYFNGLMFDETNEISNKFNKPSPRPNMNNSKENDLNNHSKNDIDSLLEVWKELETFHKKDMIYKLGVSEFTKNQLENFIQAVEVPPKVDQINFDCCSIAKEIIEFAKKNNIELLSHNDSTDILPSTTFQKILEEANTNKVRLNKDLSPRWVLKYSVMIKCRGVINNKGYIVMASTPNSDPKFTYNID
ncbi:11509_t:CDS:10 [Funneliformis geosporum]|uniref:11509_t:CDS:1 n=1 Tax=Funneliformis geosporum TaxID=1117311 RepID=A0A9W4SC84_9GLOM|nr:11509_t:CDS:10 [Funneliformis geosporum]